MSTSKSLQKPQIIQLLGGNIRIAHPDIENNTRTSLVSPIAVSGTAMSVADNFGFNDDDWFIIGEVGDQETESNDVNGAVTRGTSLTVTNTLKFSHDLDSKVTRIQERQFAIYGSATDGGALVAIKEGASAINIQWNRQFSEYMLVTGDTTYAFYAVKYYDGTTYSSASDYIPSTGWTSATVWKMAEQSLLETNSEIGGKITNELLIRSADDAQKAITQYMYQDPSGRLVQMDWDFENSYSEALTITTNENSYSLSSLAMKYPLTDKGIIGVRIGDSALLRKLNVDEYDALMFDTHLTTLTVQATSGQTSISVVSTATFADAGTLYVGGDTLTYTAKTSTTFTGIPASGTGMVTTTHAIGVNVWQNISPGLPDFYSVDRGTLKFSRPLHSDYSTFPIKIRFIKALTALTELSDSTEVNFTNAIPMFINARIEDRKGNNDKAQYWRDLFKKIVMDNCLAQRVPSSDIKSYYSFADHDSTYLDN